jgi:hypothetical protein
MALRSGQATADSSQGPPWGVRIAITFLRAFAILMALPMALMAVTCLLTLCVASQESRKAGMALAYAFSSLGIFLAFVTTILGAAWLAKHLHSSRGPGYSGSPPYMSESPGMMLGKPLLGFIILYAVAAEVAWCVAKLGSGSGTVVWLGSWAVVGTTSCYFYRKRFGTCSPYSSDQG